MKRSLLYALAMTCAAAMPVGADEAFKIPVTGEIITGWQQPDGTRIAAIRLTLEPGWKTYWRSPGDAGIPPEFDWSGSQNLRGVGITWPAPKVFLTAGMRTIGYTGDVILPIALAPRRGDAPITLRADVSMGVCRDICVPHRMQLEAVIDGQTTKPTPVIAAALAARPYSAREAGVKTATCAVRPTSDGIEIEAQVTLPSTGGNEVVIIEPGQPGLWASETKVARKGGMIVAVGEVMAEDGSAFALDRSAIRITVLGQKHAVDIKGCAPG